MSTKRLLPTRRYLPMTLDSGQPAELDFSAYHVPVKGLELIKQFTECRLTSHLRASGHLCSPDDLLSHSDSSYLRSHSEQPRYEAGWGSYCHKDGKPFVANEHIQQAEANELLLFHIRHSILPHLFDLPNWHQLNENQQGALVSFAHSLQSDLFALSPQLPLAKALRDRREYLVPDILKRYYGPAPSEDITLRRQAEADLFRSEVRKDNYTLINRSRTLKVTTPFLIGEDVKALQTALKRYGYEIEPDGVFGPVTQWAVEKFQLSVGLLANGTADAPTQRVLYARDLYLADPYLIGSDVREAQSRLAHIGYDVTVDGIFTLQTWRAIIYFQRYFGLPESGVVQGKTLVRLLYLPTEAAHIWAS